MSNLISTTLLQQGFRYIHNNPEKNLLRLTKWAEIFAQNATSKKQLEAFPEAAQDIHSPHYHFIMRFFKELAPHIVEKIIENFVLNGSWIGYKKSTSSA